MKNEDERKKNEEKRRKMKKNGERARARIFYFSLSSMSRE